MRVATQLATVGKCLVTLAIVSTFYGIPEYAFSDTGVDTSADIEGSVDPLFLSRFPYSKIVAYANPGDIVSHELVYGSLKKINRVLTPERSLLTRGKVTRITYRVPDGIRSEQVLQHYREEIVQKGDIMFYCQRRNCGSSNYWANNIFGKGLLYGPEEYQNLLVASIAVETQRYYVSVYAIQRGNQDGYVYLEIVEIVDLPDQPSSTMMEELQSFGYLVVDDFDSPGGKNAPQLTPQLESIANLLQTKPSIRLHIVARSPRGMSLESSIAESTQRAERVKNILVTTGIAPERLSAHGLGVLVPNAEGSSDRIVLVPDQY